MRGGPARRLPGNPLGGMLRDLERQTRRTTRRTGRPTPAVVEAAPEPAASPPRLAPVGEVAAVVVTGEDGRARWAFSRPYGAVPVLGAVPAGRVPVLVVVEEATATGAVVRAWTVGGEPAGGVEVHLTARPGEG